MVGAGALKQSTTLTPCHLLQLMCMAHHPYLLLQIAQLYQRTRFTHIKTTNLAVIMSIVPLQIRVRTHLTYYYLFEIFVFKSLEFTFVIIKTNWRKETRVYFKSFYSFKLFLEDEKLSLEAVVCVFELLLESYETFITFYRFAWTDKFDVMIYYRAR